MNFYVTGGSLQYDAPSYVERQADHDLLEGLLGGEFCYVLTARQMGKSSLMVRTASRLRSAGVRVAALDLTAIGGQSVTPDQWYHGLLDILGQALDLEDELEVFWQANLHLGPLHRLMKAIRHVALGRGERDASESAVDNKAEESRPSALPGAASEVRLVIFVDEIDFIRSLPFPTDEFFAAIRECYNHRPLDPAYRQLTFCLLGVASPSDLIRDTRPTPFNIGRRIELNDFTNEEAAPLAAGLQIEPSPQAAQHSAVLLARILHWTEGHPYLTQKLCRVTAETLQADGEAAQNSRTAPAVFIDQVCADLFFSHRARERDDNLIFVRERLLRSEADCAALLDLYRKIWQGKRVLDDELDPLGSLLRLAGVVRVRDGRLCERNRIYGRVFDAEWVRANMPEAELRRQREAYRRGVIWAASVSAVIILALGLLSLVAIKKSFLANLAEARAWRSSGRMGHRINALNALHKAKRWGVLFGTSVELRNEAIAALNLVDLEDAPPIVGSEGDVTGPELDRAFSRYAIADREGRILIKRVERKEKELELEPIGLPVRWLRFGTTDDYLGAGYGYGEEEGGKKRFILWRLKDKFKLVDLPDEVARDGWDISMAGDRLAVGLSQHKVSSFSLPGGEPLPAMVAPEPNRAQATNSMSPGDAQLPEPLPETIRPEARRVSFLRFDPSGTRLAECLQAGSFLYLWSVAENKIEPLPHPAAVVAVDWHPDGHQLAVACNNGDIYLHDLASKMRDRLYSASADLVPPSVCYNHMGTVLATVCSDLSLKLWRPENRRPILSSFHLNEQASVRFSGDDGRLSLADSKGRVALLRVEGGHELVTFHGEPDTVDAFQSIGFDPRGRVLLAAGPRTGLWLWDPTDVRSFFRTNLTGLVSAAGFDSSGTNLLASTTSGFFRLGVQSSQDRGGEVLEIEPAQCLAFRAGLGRFALATNGTVAVIQEGQDTDRVCILSVDDPDNVWGWNPNCSLDGIALTPNARWLFTCGSPVRGTQPEILAWDLSGGQGQPPCQRLPGSRHFSLSPSGKWLVTALPGEFQLVKVGAWSASNLPIEKSRTFEKFAPIAFAPLPAYGESLLAVATSPTTIGLFRFSEDSAAVEKLAELASPDRLPLVSLTFDPDRGRLAAGSESQIVQVWDLAQIRDGLQQRGLASDFPNFRNALSHKLRFAAKTFPQTEDDKARSRMQAEWWTKVNKLTERIGVARTNAGQDIFSDLLERGRLYWYLRHLDKALPDVIEALELRPNDEIARGLRAAVLRDLESSRRTHGSAAGSVGAKNP